MPPQLPKGYFERLLAISPDIVIAVDREGRIIFYNDGARQTLGYTQADLVDQHIQDIYPGLDAARTVMAALQSNPGGVAKNIETELISKSGDRIPVAISGSLIRDDTGAIVGSIGYAKDLREIRRHDQLATLGELACGLAHEINNPLEAVANNLGLLAKFIAEHSSDDEFVVEGERLDSIETELGKIHSAVERIDQMASRGLYETREYLPGQRMTDLGEAECEAADPADQDATATEAADGEELRVLVVDDDLAVCQSLSELLAQQNCRVRSAGGGVEALELFAKEDFDIVLSDVVMPDMDGYDLFTVLRERAPEVPVVLMTAYFFDKDHVIKRSRLEGLDQVIFKKPIDPKRVRKILVDALAQRTAAAAAAR